MMEFNDERSTLRKVKIVKQQKKEKKTYHDPKFSRQHLLDPRKGMCNLKIIDDMMSNNDRL